MPFVNSFSFLLFLTFFLQIIVCKPNIYAKNSSKNFDKNLLAPRKLRVMTFNIWESGNRVEDGLLKIAKHIKKIDADIVALQEVKNATIVSNLTLLLGKPWNGIFHQSEYPDTAIFTKHTFVNRPAVKLAFTLHKDQLKMCQDSEVVWGTGTTIQLGETGSLLNFFSLHLYAGSYGPYAANNKQCTTKEQIMAGERNMYGNGRVQNMEELLRDERFKEFVARSEEVPLIVAGDFNSPSHQDWTEETKGIHGGWVFEWPATKMLTDAGLVDSYRHLHPDIASDPGYTWSTVQKSSSWEWDYTIPEPQDRIDFIFYRGPKDFEPISSRHYNGDVPLKPIPDEWKNAYPSDHYAVITEFKYEAKSDRNIFNDVKAV